MIDFLSKPGQPKRTSRLGVFSIFTKIYAFLNHLSRMLKSILKLHTSEAFVVLFMDNLPYFRYCIVTMSAKPLIHSVEEVFKCYGLE